jgi:[acyl-carrier-protein] S-malonyltransferase
MASREMLATPLAAELLDEASRCGVDLAAALAGDDAALRPTEVAQPALLFCECVLHAAIPTDVNVVATAGHSVGEYAACVAAGALSARDAMRLVIARGRAMAAMREGTMAAFLGMDAAAVAAVCEEAARGSGEVVVVANFNAPGQTVVSGSRAGVDAAAALARERGVKRVVPLNVSGAFHSPLMAEAAANFAPELEAVELRHARIPVICNVDAEPVRAAAALRDRLGRQLTGAVRWEASVRRMTALGAEALVEVGPGSVLSGLARRIVPEVPTTSVATLEAARGLADAEVMSA